jgi:hypothetical protein
MTRTQQKQHKRTQTNTQQLHRAEANTKRNNNMSTAKNVYIVGISGKQGGAIARSLYARGADKYKIQGCR